MPVSTNVRIVAPGTVLETPLGTMTITDTVAYRQGILVYCTEAAAKLIRGVFWTPSTKAA